MSLSLASGIIRAAVSSMTSTTGGGKDAEAVATAAAEVADDDDDADADAVETGVAVVVLDTTHTGTTNGGSSDGNGSSSEVVPPAIMTTTQPQDIDLHDVDGTPAGPAAVTEDGLPPARLKQSHDRTAVDGRTTTEEEATTDTITAAAAATIGGGGEDRSEDDGGVAVVRTTATAQTRKLPRRTLLRQPDEEQGGGGNNNKTTTPTPTEKVEDNTQKKPPRWSKKCPDLLQLMCLRPTFSLRTQLFLSFGLLSVASIVVLMVTAIITTIVAGNDVKSKATSALQRQNQHSLGSSSRQVSETVTKKIEALYGVAEILVEMTQDRFMGYPNHVDYTDDGAVPFVDWDTGTHVYPINGSVSNPLPLDWEVQADVTPSNAFEHVQHRYPWYEPGPTLSTSQAMFRMKGICNPNETNLTSYSYASDCTPEHNDITTGGLVAPTPTNYDIYRRANDMSFVLKPLYEYHQEILTLGIMFANSGAGANVMFPARAIKGESTYVSTGCEWMKSANPVKKAMNKSIAGTATTPLATEEEIARCVPGGITTNSRHYNPLERAWCKEQALDPTRSHMFGPYLDAWSDHLWLISYGRAVYDRLTGEFIGCTVIDVSIDAFNKLFQQTFSQRVVEDSASAEQEGGGGGPPISSSLFSGMGSVEKEEEDNSEEAAAASSSSTSGMKAGEEEGGDDDGKEEEGRRRKSNNHNIVPKEKTELALVKWDSVGTVMVSTTGFNPDSSNTTVSISSLQSSFGLTHEDYLQILSSVDFDEPWNPDDVRRVFEDLIFVKDRQLVAAYPVPVPPKVYSASYRPEFVVIRSTDITQVYDEIESMDRKIDESVRSTIAYTLGLGFGGMGAILVVIFIVSFYLTKPLNWLEITGKVIVDNFGYELKENTRGRKQDNSKKGGGGNHSGATTEEGGGGIADDVSSSSVLSSTSHQNFSSPFAKCTPNTEVTALVKEFDEMVSKFSGKGTAVVVKEKVQEVRNPFNLTRVFLDLYRSRAQDIERGIKYTYRDTSSTSTVDTASAAAEEASFFEGGGSNRGGGVLFGSFSSLNQGSNIAEIAASAILRGSYTQGMNATTGGATSSEVNLRSSGAHSVCSAATVSELRRSHNAGGLGGEGGRPVVESESGGVSGVGGGGVKFSASVTSKCLRVHMGPNVHLCRSGSTKLLMHEDRRASVSLSESSAGRSPLFWWIVGLILTPLVITTVLIATLVILELFREPPTWLDDVKAASSDQALETLAAMTYTRAQYASEVITVPIRDLHVQSRVAAWLLFGALDRSTSFTRSRRPHEECKTYDADQSCPVFSDREYASCDCRWNDGHAVDKCYMYNETDSRYLQETFFFGLSEDHGPNGERNSTSFPAVATTPETTEIWHNVTSMPGSDEGASASGYSTTYDRTRVGSALATVTIPLYNYAKVKHLALLTGFEADGMVLGYEGCAHNYLELHNWQSTKDNGASELAPNLCPMGKYGYDPRCRGWYVHGRDDAQEGVHDDGRLLHFTPPYLSAAYPPTTVQTASFPLFDPASGEPVAVGLIDFVPNDIVESLRSDSTPVGPGKRGFPLLITGDEREASLRPVVGPLYELGNETVNTYDLVGGSREEFGRVLEGMMAGNESITTFVRKNPDDGREEKVYVSYAPITALSLNPKNHADMSSGVDVFSPMVYSLALVLPESDLVVHFDSIHDELNRILYLSVAVFICLLIISVGLGIWIGYRVTVAITVPIVKLLEVVENVNRHNFGDALPEHEGGSREVKRVYETFEKLYKVIRVANSAFFCGDLEKAYEMLVDALGTFTQLNDRKAIGIANNNLGNTMLSMYEQIQLSGKENHMLTKQEIISKGINFFDQAIECGEEALEKIHKEMGWSNMCLVFMQQLSNRYFNRAMFLMTVRNDHPEPIEAEEMGKRDLMVAKDMDLEVIEHREQQGLRFDADSHFDLVFSRMRGLVRLLEMSYADDWDIEELLDDTATQICLASQDGGRHKRENEVGPVGRMQQLDEAVVQYMNCTSKGSIEAAKVGIRMLVEDEYVIPDSGLAACAAVRRFVISEREKGNDKYAGTEIRLLAFETIFRNAMVSKEECTIVGGKKISSRASVANTVDTLVSRRSQVSTRSLLSTEAY